MAMSRAEIERRRQEAAHANATGKTKSVKRRCLIEGCPEYMQWSPCVDARAADLEQRAHYMQYHYVRPSPELIAALAYRGRGVAG